MQRFFLILGTFPLLSKQFSSTWATIPKNNCTLQKETYLSKAATDLPRLVLKEVKLLFQLHLFCLEFLHFFLVIVPLLLDLLVLALQFHCLTGVEGLPLLCSVLLLCQICDLFAKGFSFVSQAKLFSFGFLYCLGGMLLYLQQYSIRNFMHH